MCAIFGVVGRSDHRGLREAALTLRHRGPDGFGDYSSPDRVAYLAHCRLAIIDLSDAGRQPMANEDGSIQLTFNGEIYNFQELRAQLIAAGHRFVSNTDSEVIVHGYAQWGERVVERLRGMFAFAIWDSVRQRLFLARDHLGIKPLYYRLRGGELYFASEPKAILCASPHVPTIDVDSCLQFLRLGYTHGPRTVYEGIVRLPPGSTLCLDAATGVVERRVFWRPEVAASIPSEQVATETLHALLADTVREQMISDVKLGVFLSGGIDSSLVAAFAAQARPDIDSYFVDVLGWQGSERGDAAAAAQHLRTRHHVREIDGSQFRLADPDQAGRIFATFDEPMSDAAIIPNWHLAALMKRDVGVALSGDGGDELFGGYAWYRQVRATPRRRFAWRAEHLRRSIGLGREWPQGCASQHEYYHLLQCPSFTRSELHQLFPAWRKSIDTLGTGVDPGASDLAEHDQRYWQDLDFRTFLVDNNLARMDRASMAHGLEVRVPLLDHRVAELSLSLPASLIDASRDGGKPLLRRLAQSLLPSSVVAKRKQGFSFPVDRLISMAEMSRAVSSGVLLRSGVIDRAGWESWSAQAPRSNRQVQLWQLFIFETWASRWMPGVARAA